MRSHPTGLFEDFPGEEKGDASTYLVVKELCSKKAASPFSFSHFPRLPGRAFPVSARKGTVKACLEIPVSLLHAKVLFSSRGTALKSSFTDRIRIAPWCGSFVGNVSWPGVFFSTTTATPRPLPIAKFTPPPREPW